MQPTAIEGKLSYGPNQPSSIPRSKLLTVGRSFYYTNTQKQPGEPDYEPVGEDGLRIVNGPRIHNHILTAGRWWLKAGDRPRTELQVFVSGGYAEPALLPDIGVGGRLRVWVTSGQEAKWLDRFETIEAVLSPGSATWICSDAGMGAVLELRVVPSVEAFAYVAEARLLASANGPVGLAWVFGRVGPQGDKVEVRDRRVSVSNPTAYRHTYILAECDSAAAKISTGAAEMLDDDYERTMEVAGSMGGRSDDVCSVMEVTLGPAPDDTAVSRWFCAWGYANYDRQAVEDAYRRLAYRPFADPVWVEQMKAGWFDHWIGKGLHPDRTLTDFLGQPDKLAADADAFWQQQRTRLRIRTPDARFDTVVNHVSANLRNQFEYPAFKHGMRNYKYGKINCGYYGYECAGMHGEVEASLKFITGAQDIKGRMRYFEPVFSIAAWCEEQDFYFVEQVWHHYCWTGDRQFVRTMWPAARRALEHALAACDPDGDGIMTSYYETWNQDSFAMGGKCVLFTGLARSALKAGIALAEIAGEYDTRRGALNRLDFDEPLAYFQRVLERLERNGDAPFWIEDAGAWGSAEWDGNIRPYPGAMEQNYILWRGWGEREPMKRYAAVRYIRDNYHLTTAPGVEMELINAHWPILWSQHYVANGDTCMSVLSACQAGDADRYWTTMKTIAETLYNSDTATLCHGVNNDGRGGGMRSLVELEPQFIQAVVEGLFGIRAQFGDNILIIRPNFPSHWADCEIETTDFKYAYVRKGERLTVRIQLPLARKVRLELPVAANALQVRQNGEPVAYTMEAAVNGSRLIVMTDAGTSFHVEADLGEPAAVEGELQAARGEWSRFVVRGAAVARVHDLQNRCGPYRIEPQESGATVVSVQLAHAGKYTVFLELQSGDARWYHPLDLDVREPWSIAEESLSAFREGGPSVQMPKVDPVRQSFTLELANDSRHILDEPAAISIAGGTWNERVRIAPGARQRIELDLRHTWNKLSPGTIPVDVRLAGQTRTAQAVEWTPEAFADVAGRIRMLDLSEHFNIGIGHLYSPNFQWRHDYTGCGIGIDQRDPLPLKDEKGYVLMHPPVSLFAYSSLIEQTTYDWRTWHVPDFRGRIETETGVPFAVGEHPLPEGKRGNVVALASNEPYGQLAGGLTITLDKAVRLEKIYLLTANLTKTVKAYYPGAEADIRYSTGQTQTVQLIPPHSMPNVFQHVSPRAYAVDFGSMTPPGDDHFWPLRPHLAVTDIVLDPSREVQSIELKCVASQTIFGIMGISVLLAQSVG